MDILIMWVCRSKYTVPILGPFHVFMNMATTVVAMFQQVLRPLATVRLLLQSERIPTCKSLLLTPVGFLQAHGFRGPYQQDYLFHGGDMHKLRDFLTIAARTIAQHLSGTQLSAEVERDLRCVLMEPDKVKNRRVAVLMQCWWYIALVLGYDSAIDVGDVDRMFAIEREFLPLCLTGNKTMYSRMIAWRALVRALFGPMHSCRVLMYDTAFFPTPLLWALGTGATAIGSHGPPAYGSSSMPAPVGETESNRGR